MYNFKISTKGLMRLDSLTKIRDVFLRLGYLHEHSWVLKEIEARRSRNAEEPAKPPGNFISPSTAEELRLKTLSETTVDPGVVQTKTSNILKKKKRHAEFLRRGPSKKQRCSE